MAAMFQRIVGWSVFAAVFFFAGGFGLGYTSGWQNGMRDHHLAAQAYRAQMMRQCADQGALSGVLRASDGDVELCWSGSGQLGRMQ